MAWENVSIHSLPEGRLNPRRNNRLKSRYRKFPQPINVSSPSSLSTQPIARKKSGVLAGIGILGAFGLGGVLAVIAHKRPAWLSWSRRQTVQVAETRGEPLPVNPLKPLTYCSDKVGIQQRHALSVEIVNELWPDILKFAEQKPPGWDKALEEKYNQIIRKKLNVPNWGQVEVRFNMLDSSSTGALPPLSRRLNEKEPFLLGSLNYDKRTTHFDPRSLDEQQEAFAVLTHETNHMLRALAQTEPQYQASYKVMSSIDTTDFPLGLYEAGPALLRNLIGQELSKNSTSGLPPILKKNWDIDAFHQLSEEQKTSYWGFLKQQWNKPGYEQVKLTPQYYNETFEGLKTHSPEHLKTAIEFRYLNELESYALAMHRAPGVPPEVMAGDLKAHARAFDIRQKIRAYYDHFNIPPEKQSDLVKDWELKLIPNPVDS